MYFTVMLSAEHYLVVVCSGTDATHAEHIETIKARLYVGVRPDGKFVPGELGMGLVEGVCPCSESCLWVGKGGGESR